MNSGRLGEFDSELQAPKRDYAIYHTQNEARRKIKITKEWIKKFKATEVVHLHAYMDMRDFSNIKKNDIATAAEVVIASVEVAMNNVSETEDNFTPMMELLDQLRVVTDDPIKANCDQFHAIASKVIDHRKGGRIIGGAILCFVGLCLIAASIVATVLTGGLAVPASVLGIKVGLSLLAVGLFLGAGVTLLATGGLFTRPTLVAPPLVVEAAQDLHRKLESATPKV